MQIIRYQQCPNSNEVLFYKIINGGHTWPDGFVSIPAYGNTNRDISGTDEIWNFFNRYTLDGLATGIDEVKSETAISIYPNPAANTLNISANYTVLHADVYDAAGRKVIASSKNKTIDLSSLESGMYVVKIFCDHDVQSVVKFTKQ